MKTWKRLLASLMILTMLVCAVPPQFETPYTIRVEAHSGRTDSSGGHRDNRNVSGLGYYHYHCGGYPPHLHSGRVCPYRRPSTPQKTPQKKPTLTINKKSLTLTVGASKTLKLNINAKKATWKSSNKKIVSVSKKGKVTAKQPGKVTISAKYNGMTVTCKVKVKK